MNGSDCHRQRHRGSGERGGVGGRWSVQTDGDLARASGNRTYPVTAQHSTSEVHPYRRDERGFGPQEAVVEQGDLHQKLRESPRLDVIVVGF